MPEMWTYLALIPNATDLPESDLPITALARGRAEKAGAEKGMEKRKKIYGKRKITLDKPGRLSYFIFQKLRQRKIQNKGEKMKRYQTTKSGAQARIDGGYLYVRVTNGRDDMLESGGRLGMVYRMSYTGTMADATKENQYGVSDIDRCIDNPANIIRRGTLIN